MQSLQDVNWARQHTMPEVHGIKNSSGNGMQKQRRNRGHSEEKHPYAFSLGSWCVPKKTIRSPSPENEGMLHTPKGERSAQIVRLGAQPP